MVQLRFLPGRPRIYERAFPTSQNGGAADHYPIPDHNHNLDLVSRLMFIRRSRDSEVPKIQSCAIFLLERHEEHVPTKSLGERERHRKSFRLLVVLSTHPSLVAPPIRDTIPCIIMAALLKSALQILSLAVEADESSLFDEAARLYDRGSCLLEQYLHCTSIVGFLSLISLL